MADMWRHIFDSRSAAYHAPTLLVLRWLIGLSFLPLLACSGSVKDVETIEPKPAHHRADGYQNNYTEYQNKGLGKVLQWKWAALRNGLPVSPKEPTPQRTPDLPFINENAKAGMMMQPTVTWIGHSTTLVQMSGLSVLTDPIFSDHASPFKWIGPKRTQPPGLSLEQLPHIDVVLISHNHYDHCDEDSLQAGFDLALIPVGAYEPRWFMREEHVNPEEAVRIHNDVRSNQSIGVHWGTFMLTDEALDQPPHDLAEAVRKAGLSADAFTIMAICETRKLTPRHTQSVAPAD